MEAMMKTTQKPRLPQPVVITEPPQLASLLDDLSRQPAIAVDTESNSLYAYEEQVCLIQFSVPGTDYLVDPLSDLDISSLGAVFASPAVEKVFHAAEYDVMCLRRDFGWTFANLFDTMWAARVLGWPHYGLGSILEERFGVQLNKRWQRHDWGRRPLSPKALAYAQLDTHYLLPLRDEMLAALKRERRLEEAREFFVEVAQAEPNFKPFDADRDLWRTKGVWELDPEDRAVLRELLIWRDAEAQRQNRPPFKVINNRPLIALAQARPQRVEHTRGIKGFKDHHWRRYGGEIARAVSRGVNASPPQPPPRSTRPPDDVLARYEALRDWRKQVAAKRGTDPDVIVSNAALWVLAKKTPCSLDQLAELDVLGPWKQKKYGDTLLSIVCERS
jgi:ribonuclease D